jgi:hypothetical protein
MPVISPSPVVKQQTKKCSGGLLIAIITGVLVDNTITKTNNHFGSYCDNESESTHGLYEIFAQNNLLNRLAKSVGFTAEHSVYSTVNNIFISYIPSRIIRHPD